MRLMWFPRPAGRPLARAGFPSARLAALAILLLLGPAPAGAQPDIAGSWEATEFDPLLGSNAFFGQFRYRMEISREGDGYAVRVPRTGGSFAPAPLQGDRLVTQGRDASRGPATLDITFADGSFRGTIAFDGDERRIEGRLSSASRLSTVESAAREAEARARSTAAESQALRAEVADLQRQIGALSDRLAAEAAARRDAEAKLGAANRRIAELERAAASRDAPAREAARPIPLLPPARPTAAAPAGAAPPGPVRPTGAPKLELIEPPYDPGSDGPEIVTHELPTTRLVGRVGSPVGLLSLRLNGQELQPDAQGLFSAPVAVGPGGTPVRLVAIDRDGRRTALTVTLRPAAPDGGRDAAASSAAERCYRLGIAAAAPAEAAVEACRQAVEEAPDAALNHYNLAVTLSRLGRHQEAILSYQEAAGRWAR